MILSSQFAIGNLILNSFRIFCELVAQVAIHAAGAGTKVYDHDRREVGGGIVRDNTTPATAEPGTVPGVHFGAEHHAHGVGCTSKTVVPHLADLCTSQICALVSLRWQLVG